MQSSQYLNAREDWRQLSVENNAVAARKVSEEADKSQAGCGQPDGGGDLRTEGISGGN